MYCLAKLEKYALFYFIITSRPLWQKLNANNIFSVLQFYLMQVQRLTAHKSYLKRSGSEFIKAINNHNRYYYYY